MSSRPRVYCRIRPLNEKEGAVEGKNECFFDKDGNTLLYHKADGDVVRSRFDSVMGPATDQKTVYRLLKDEVTSSLMTGYNATVFAYGQTGSGKTYTMEGQRAGDQRGLIHNFVSEIFDQFAQKKDVENVSVQMSYVQIYQDQIQDLLQARKLLDIRLDKSGAYIASGACWRDVSSATQAMNVYYDAAKNRATNSTDMNLVSSRSHALLQFQLKWDEPLAPGSNAKLNLVDLAGSEKVSLSGATGEVLKEAIAINKSLSALSNVVKALVDQARDPGKRHHVPYKDSKLTYLLQSSLGGNNLVHFILCLSASVLYRNEGNSTIEFGKRALKVVLKPVKNPIDYRRLEEMERMIEQMRQHISELEGKLSQKGAQGGAADTSMTGKKPAGENEKFLVMDDIAQDNEDEGGPGGRGKQAKDLINAEIKKLEEQQRTVEERLVQRGAELEQLKGSNAKEREQFQSKFTEEKRRYMEELNILRCNVQRQRERLEQGEEEVARARHKRAKRSMRIEKIGTRQKLKNSQELERIYKTLPESLHELTSHCILFPDSKEHFRKLGGLKKLIALIDCRGNKGRESYIAHASYALSIALDELGRDEVRELGGVHAVSQVLSRTDEHSKQFACRALEAVVRGNAANKREITDDVLLQLCGLVGTHPHQQVQEAACSALAEIADSLPDIKEKLMLHGLIRKMVSMIRDTPPEVADLIKVGVTVVGRLAQQHLPCQNEIAALGGVKILADTLFSSVGDRDPQLPVLTAYALVNICCNNRENMIILQKHPKWADIKFKVLEGLGRVFSDSIASENRIRATASHSIRSDGGRELFGYHGVTCVSEWSPFTAGGRPTYSSFMENPQFTLTVSEDCNVSIVLSDLSCEDRHAHRTASKQKTIYMGLAVFRGDRALLCDRGLKQLDFNGRFVTSGRFNRNRENTLSLPLKGSPDPYIIVPFTAHLMQYTRFCLGVFADKEVEVTQVPEEGGWLKRVFEGSWTTATGRGADAFDWRNTDQFLITVAEETTVTAVLSYRAVDEFRTRQALAADDEEVPDDSPENEEARERPHLHGRVFSSSFAPNRRYVRSNVPSPQNTSFVACNEYLSSSSVKTTVTLQPNQTYVYVPSTETPCVDEYRVSFYSDSNEVNVSTLNPSSEWYAFKYKGTWPADSDSSPSRSPFVLLNGGGKVVIIGSAKDVYLLLSVYEILDNGRYEKVADLTPAVKTKKLASCDAFWANECVLETTLPDANKSYWVTLQGIVTLESGEQRAVTEGDYTLAVYAEDINVTCTSNDADGLMLVDRLNATPEVVTYGVEKLMNMRVGGGEELVDAGMHYSEGESDASDEEEPRVRFEKDGAAEAKHATALAAASAVVAQKDEEVEALKAQLAEKAGLVEKLQQALAAQTPHTTPTPPAKKAGPLRRGSGSASSARQLKKNSMGGGGLNAAKSLRSADAAPQPDLAPVVSASDGVCSLVTSFAALEHPPSAVEFRRLQQELQRAAAKLRVATSAAEAPPAKNARGR